MERFLGGLGGLLQCLGTVHVLGSSTSVQESEAPVAKAHVPDEAGVLHGELLLLQGLQLGDVQRGVEHAELEPAVEAHVGADPVRMNCEGTCLFRHHCRQSL